MDIESYDFYHIGLKLNVNTINLDLLLRTLKEKLKDKGYEPREDEAKVTLDIKTGALSSEFISLAQKNNIEIRLNIAKAALAIVSLHGREKVTEAFEDVLKVFEEVEWDLEQAILVYEIVVRMNVKSDKSPIQTLKNSSKLDLEPIKNLGDNLAVQSIKITPMGKNPSGKEWSNIAIEPKLLSPNSRYFVYILYRNPDKKKILEVHENLEKMIISLLRSIEK